MKTFAEITERAARRKGGMNELKKLLPDGIKTAKQLGTITDDRWLSGMTRAVFKAGFVWKIIDHKWPGFEEAFWNFDPARCAGLSPDEEDALCRDQRIVRNRQKILTVPHNAVMIIEAGREHGSFGRMVADWPADDFVGLLDYLGRNGARLGGMTAQYFLRAMGKDGFALSRDGVAALIDAGVVSRQPTGKADKKRVQDACNLWSDESGYGLAEISRILALSIDAPKT
ncbi:MAG: 3-methyladenine DNA glycosylase [Desulfuromonas sp.]|nr:MAG: 3-methyladenine DNA glycosylase [Desulfuromonas sp.]